MGKPRADEVDDLESSGISLDGGIKVHTTTFIRGATACIGASIATIAHASQLVLAQGGGQSDAKSATVMIGTGVIVLIVVIWFAAKSMHRKSKPAKGRGSSGSTRLR